MLVFGHHLLFYTNGLQFFGFAYFADFEQLAEISITTRQYGHYFRVTLQVPILKHSCFCSTWFDSLKSSTFHSHSAQLMRLCYVGFQSSVTITTDGLSYFDFAQLADFLNSQQKILILVKIGHRIVKICGFFKKFLLFIKSCSGDF